MPEISDLITEFETKCKAEGYNLEAVALYNPRTDRIFSNWNDQAEDMEQLEALAGVAISLVGLADKNDAKIQLALSRAYSAHGLHYTKPDTDPQEELFKAIVGAGMHIGAEIVKEAQDRARAQELVNDPIQELPEGTEDEPQPMKCRRHCVNCFRGQCMIFNEDEIAPDTHLCERYEKYQGRNQWGV